MDRHKIGFRFVHLDTRLFSRFLELLFCFRIKLFYLFGLEPAQPTTHGAIQDTEQQERLQNRIQDLTNQVRYIGNVFLSPCFIFKQRKMESSHKHAEMHTESRSLPEARNLMDPCAYARWAHMRRFQSVIDQNSLDQNHQTKIHVSGSLAHRVMNFGMGMYLEHIWVNLEGQGQRSMSHVKKMCFYGMLHSFLFWKCDRNPVKGPWGQGQKLKVVGQRSRSKTCFSKICMVYLTSPRGERLQSSRSKVTWVKVKSHIYQGQTRITKKGKWAHNNIKLLRYLIYTHTHKIKNLILSNFTWVRQDISLKLIYEYLVNLQLERLTLAQTEQAGRAIEARPSTSTARVESVCPAEVKPLLPKPEPTAPASKIPAHPQKSICDSENVPCDIVPVTELHFATDDSDVEESKDDTGLSHSQPNTPSKYPKPEQPKRSTSLAWEIPLDNPPKSDTSALQEQERKERRGSGASGLAWSIPFNGYNEPKRTPENADPKKSASCDVTKTPVDLSQRRRGSYTKDKAECANIVNLDESEAALDLTLGKGDEQGIRNVENLGAGDAQARHNKFHTFSQD